MSAPIPLPAISNVAEAADFAHTVGPFLDQLSAAHILPVIRGEVAPAAWYISTNPLIAAIILASLVAVMTFVLGETTRNCSQVDRMWSLLPAIYGVHFAVWARMAGVGSDRVDMAATLVALWSVRLTFNYWRKGGYSPGSEDYRWPIIRAYINSPPLFTLFNAVFISAFQNAVLLGIATPIYVLLLAPAPELTLLDTIFSRGLAVVILLEGLADQQQWWFQCAKAEYKATGEMAKGFTKEDLERGFVVTGLWSFCRHPNFLCEQLTWFGLYQWACFVTDTMLNWSGLGVGALWAIFQGSTWLTELITAGKYPEYKEYQVMVNRFIPGRLALFGGEEKAPLPPPPAAVAGGKKRA